MLKHKRPISPHLVVYTPTFTLQRSIFHRVSGLLLCLCLIAIILSFKFTLINSFSWSNYSIISFIFFIIHYLKNIIFCSFLFHVLSGLQQLSKLF